MKAFLELRARPDPETSGGQVLNQAMQRLHEVLVREKALLLGVSFPEQREGKHASLGGVLRIHGSFDELDSLADGRWLFGAREALALGTVAATPKFAKGFVKVTRVQPKVSPERACRRRARFLMKTDAKSEQEAMVQARQEANERGRVETELNLPYVRLRSTSTGQLFRLFVKQTLTETPGPPQAFSRFGLSLGGTVPYW